MTTEPVGLAINLARGRVMRAQIRENDLAVWRSSSGQLSAWANRCPHRGMRLSYGFVRGESLACAYHGWHYNCQGKCHYIPAHPELEPPPSIKPEIFSVAELNGVLWVSVDGTAQPESIPDSLRGLRTITFNCTMRAAADAFQSTEFNIADQQKFQSKELSGETLMLGYVASDLSPIESGGTTESLTLVVLFQCSGPDTTNCHIMVAKNWSSQELVKVSRWCELVRRVAETGVPESDNNMIKCST